MSVEWNRPEPPAAKSPRPAWLVAGGVLWLLVAVTAFAFVRAKKPVAEANPLDERNVPRTIRVEPEDGAAGPPIAAIPAEQTGASLAPWNLDGIDDFQFTERSGRTVTKADLLGRPWIVCFIFTRCAGPCRDITTQMSRLQEALRETDVRLVTLTVDPDYDTPEILVREADAFGADAERWLFLTGRKADIYGLIHKSFRMPVKELTGPDRKPGWEVVHSTNLLLVDAKGVVQAKYDGAKPDQVAALIERLTGPAIAEIPEEAAEGRP